MSGRTHTSTPDFPVLSRDPDPRTRPCRAAGRPLGRRRKDHALSNLGREVAGAWRSLRYDLTRRPDPAAPAAPAAARSPEPAEPEPAHRRHRAAHRATPAPRRAELVAEQDLTADIYPDHEPPPYRSRRRLLGATAFGALAVAGATGTYLVVVGSLGALAGDEVAAPEGLPVVVTSGSATQTTQTARAVTPSPSPSRPAMSRPTPSHRAVLGRAPVVPPAPSPTCACVTPPVPRPTSPPPVTDRPHPTPTTAPPGSPSPSAEPTDQPSDPPPSGG